MKVLKKILSIIFNPFNSITIGKGNEKSADTFSKHPIFIFIVSLFVTAVIFVLGYFVI